MRRTAKWLAISVSVLLTLGAAGYGYHRYQYPWGASHCCDLGLYMALQEYAASHGGSFPAGQATPEASLSLLYASVPECADANLLRGKTVPEAEVAEILGRGELLGPESCGWHYVEGLRLDDDPRLGVFWDKAGLGHDGRRLKGGGHIVMFVDGERKQIPEDEWPTFIDEQQRLLAVKTQGEEIRADATLQIGGQQFQVQLRVVDDELYGRVWKGGRNSGMRVLAHVNHEPQVGVVGLPVVSAAEVKNAKVVVDQQKERIQFALREKAIVFADGDFWVVSRTP